MFSSPYRDVDPNVKYCPQTQRVPGEKATPYPVLSDQNKNQYTPMPPTKVDADAKMDGPVYQGVDSSNQYCEIKERVSAPQTMAGPKYQNVVEAHKYGVVNPRVKG